MKTTYMTVAIAGLAAAGTLALVATVQLAPVGLASLIGFATVAAIVTLGATDYRSVRRSLVK